MRQSKSEKLTATVKNSLNQQFMQLSSCAQKPYKNNSPIFS